MHIPIKLLQELLRFSLRNSGLEVGRWSFSNDLILNLLASHESFLRKKHAASSPKNPASSSLSLLKIPPCFWYYFEVSNPPHENPPFCWYLPGKDEFFHGRAVSFREGNNFKHWVNETTRNVWSKHTPDSVVSTRLAPSQPVTGKPRVDSGGPPAQ